MATEVTTVALGVDTSQVTSASAALDKMAQAGGRAETASSRLAKAHAAMLAELRGIGSGVQELVKLAAAQGRASSASEQLAKSRAKATLEGHKASEAIKDEARSISANLIPAAEKGAQAIGKLSLTGFNTSGIKHISDELSLAATQAARAAAAIGNVSSKAGTISFARGTVVTPVQQTIQSHAAASHTVAAAPSSIAQLVPTSSAAKTAVDKLTASAKVQTPVFQHLTPAVSATAASYKQIAAQPIRIPTPEGLSKATAALRAATDQAERFKASVSGITNAQGPQSRQAQSAAPTAQVGTAPVAAARALAEAHREQAKAAKLATFQQQQLGFQLNDFFVQVVSGGSPLTALIQQGSQLSGTFGGAGNALKAVTALITPARVAIGGLAGIIAGVGYAFYEGSKQSKAFADSIVLTGNYAGQTEAKFNSLAKSIASSGQVTVAASREAAQAILATGQIGPQSFASAAQAAALYAEATGKAADEVAADFARMTRAPAKWAVETNRSLHFLTAAQVEMIKSFEDSGRAADAQNVIFDALNARLKALDPNLGTIERTLRSVKNGWKSFWDAAYDIGRTETIDSKLKKIDAQIKLAERGQLNNQRPTGIDAFQYKDDAPTNRAPKIVGDLQEQRRELLKKQFRENENAFAESNRAIEQQAGIEANELIDKYRKIGKASSLLAEETKKVNKAFDDADRAGTPVSAADKAAAIKGVQKQFAPGGTNEAQQILRANLEKDIKTVHDKLEEERDTIAFNERFLQGEYQAGQKSLTEFYAGKRATIQQGATADIQALEKERSALLTFQKKNADKSEGIQIQARLDDNAVQQARVRATSAREQQLLNQEEAASFTALGETVINYRANLLQLQGDEFGAAQKRAEVAIQQAKVLAGQAGSGLSQSEVQEFIKITDISNKFNEVQRRTQILSSASRTAEESYLLAAEARGSSLRETESGLYEIRKRELDQLGELAKKAQELAAASTNPAIKQFAADLANEYAKAAAAVDPALNRLRDAQKELASSLTSTLANLPKTFADAYQRRRDQSESDIKNQKDEYTRRIDILEGYLAESQDKQDKARLRAKIKDLEAQKKDAKRESKGSSFLKAVNDSVIQPFAQQALATVNKLVVTDPLQKMIEQQLKGLTEGEGALAGFFKDTLGIKGDPKEAALAQQTAAVKASTTALDLLEAAARGAADSLGSRGIPSAGGALPGSSESEGGLITDQFGDLNSNIEDVNSGSKDFAKALPTVTNVLGKLAGASSSAGQAMGILPSIISSIAAASAASSTSSGASGLIGLFGSMFGGSSGAASGTITNELFHDGGIVGSPSQYRTTNKSVFNSAKYYHTGGLAGLKADEVPAILMGGPKGKREEVLHADDPRHRDNLPKGIFKAVVEARKHAQDGELSSLFKRLGVKHGINESAITHDIHVRGAREFGGHVSKNSAYLVNERGPELLKVAGKQYLMTGQKSGMVEQTQKQKPSIHIENHINTGGAAVDRRTIDQVAAATQRGVQRASARNN